MLAVRPADEGAQDHERVQLFGRGGAKLCEARREILWRQIGELGGAVFEAPVTVISMHGSEYAEAAKLPMQTEITLISAQSRTAPCC